MDPRRTPLNGPLPKPPEVNSALRELAARIHKLSYRDLKTLGEAVRDGTLTSSGAHRLPTILKDDFEAGLLSAADRLKDA